MNEIRVYNFWGYVFPRKFLLVNAGWYYFAILSFGFSFYSAVSHLFFFFIRFGNSFNDENHQRICVNVFVEHTEWMYGNFQIVRYRVYGYIAHS